MIHDSTSLVVSRLDLALKASLFLLAFAAPLSIAATQTAWSLAILFWMIRAFFVRPTLRKDGLDLAIIAFVGLTILSSAFSYEPEVSIRKLVAVSLVTIVYLVSGYVGDAKTIRKIVVVLLISGVVSVAYTLGTLAVGKNLKVERLTADSPLRVAGVQENDTILTVNDKGVNSPEELSAASALSENGITKLKIYRYEYLLDYNLPVSSVLDSGDASAKFGIADWSRGRDKRAAGFFGHYTTYAEAIQLVLSLAFGLMIVVPGGFFSKNRILLGTAVAAFCVALFLTVTRASWAGFAVSAAVIVLLGTSRKTVLICLVFAIPVALSGIFYLQQKRNVSFIDAKDDSTVWRMTVWRESFGVLVSSPRHLAVGIGMDSLKTHWQDWQMFKNGHIPLGHLHSTPLQLAFERGVPVLIAWIIWMFLYLRMLWRGTRQGHFEWFERGILLGALGGTIGFLTSGLVHYNWGDSEIVMIFYLLMGLSLAILRAGPGGLAICMTKPRRSILFGPLPPPFGGVSVFMKTIYAAAIERGVNVWSYKGDTGGQAGTRRVNHRRLVHIWALVNDGWRARVTDSSHFHLEYPNILLLPVWLAAKFVLRFEWVKLLHDGSLPSRSSGFDSIQKLLFRMAIRGIDEIIVYSRDLERWLTDTAGFRGKITFIPLLLPLPADWGTGEIVPWLEEKLRRFSNYPKRVCSIGVFIPSYGFHSVAEAVERLRSETGENIGLFFVDGRFAGDDIYRENVREGRDWIEVVEGVPHDDLGGVFRASDVFVRAFEHESFGLSRVEALWSGTPVIATNVGETRGMMLYDFDDVAALIEHLRTVLDGDFDTDIAAWARIFRDESEQNLKNYLDAITGETDNQNAD